MDDPACRPLWHQHPSQQPQGTWNALWTCGSAIPSSWDEYFAQIVSVHLSDEKWELVAPYFALPTEDVGQREYSLREVFNSLRTVIGCGCRWRMMPDGLPPWAAVCQQGQRWLAAGCFVHLADDLRAVLRLAVDTPGHLIALHLTPASVDDRTQVGRLAEAVQAVTGDSAAPADVDRGHWR